MSFSLGTILSALTVCMVITMTAAYQLAKKRARVDGLIYSLILLGLGVFWVILSYSLYFLVAITTQYFDQPKVPYLMQVLWPSALLPYAPLLLALFGWWHSFLQAIYWIHVEGASEEERVRFRKWHNEKMMSSIRKWGIAYLVLFVAVQVWYRVPYFSTIPLPVPLP